MFQNSTHRIFIFSTDHGCSRASEDRGLSGVILDTRAWAVLKGACAMRMPYMIEVIILYKVVIKSFS